MPASHPGVPCVCVSSPLPGAQRACSGCLCSWARLGRARADAGAGPHRRLCSGVHVVAPPPAPPPAWWRLTAPPIPPPRDVAASGSRSRSLDLQPGSASRRPSGGRRLWAWSLLLDSRADMLLDLSDLLQVDAPPPPRPPPCSDPAHPGWEGPQAKDREGLGLGLETGGQKG